MDYLFAIVRTSNKRLVGFHISARQIVIFMNQHYGIKMSPNLLSRPCNRSRCPNVQVVNGYCMDHQVKRDHKNEKPSDPFYSTGRLTKTSLRYRRKNPLCQDCLSKGQTVRADLVHHIVPVKDSKADRLRVENLRSLCVNCHSKYR